MTDAAHISSPLPAGVHRIPEQAYHADLIREEPTLSSTLARLLVNQSPLHAWTAHPRLNPNHEPTDSPTFDIGRAAHRAALGAGADWAVYPTEYLAKNGAASTKEAKEWATFQRDAGRTPIKPEQEDAILEMADAVWHAMAEAGVNLNRDRSEMSALGRVDGVWCRAMIDNAPADPRAPLYDLKTTTNANPRAIERSFMNYGYADQAAHYLAAWHAATGEHRTIQFVFVEKTAPFGVTVAQPTGAALDTAMERMAAARKLWGDCLASDEWPGYPRAVLQIDLPDFYHARAREDLLIAGDWRDAEKKPSREAIERWNASIAAAHAD